MRRVVNVTGPMPMSQLKPLSSLRSPGSSLSGIPTTITTAITDSAVTLTPTHNDGLSGSLAASKAMARPSSATPSAASRQRHR